MEALREEIYDHTSDPAQESFRNQQYQRSSMQRSAIVDSLFSDMAITIVFGLTVATLLILFVVPLLYSIFYKIDKPKEN